jgi:hypothetical protein
MLTVVNRHTHTHTHLFSRFYVKLRFHQVGRLEKRVNS